MDFSYVDKATRRHCYLPVAALEQLYKEPVVLDALIEALAVPGKPTTFKKLGDNEKRAAIEQHIEHLRRLPTSPWLGAHALEVLAAGVYSARRAIGASIEKHLFPVEREEHLAAPVTEWLKQKGLSVVPEVPLGMNRVDLLGYKDGFWSGKQVVAVELKNDLQQLKRGVDQMTTYADYAQKVYLACTPDLAASYLAANASAEHVPAWDGAVLARKLQKLSVGLLLVEGSAVYEVHSAGDYRPSDEKLDAVERLVKSMTARTTAAQR